jgi:hypothetical protein
MSAGKDLLAEAAVRACTFDFTGAEELCRRVLAQDDDPRARALLRAIEHNRSSCLYSLAATGSHPEAPGLRQFCRRLSARARNILWRSGKIAGSFGVRFEKTGMVVTGSVYDASKRVHLFINELLVASAPIEPDTRSLTRAGTFVFRIDRPSLSLFPRHEKVRLAVSTGEAMLRPAVGGTFHRCDWPDGKGGIEDAILKGAMLTGHHRIRPPAAPEKIGRWLDAYEKLAAFMDETRGKPLFLYYGSLLGAVRDNRIIPYDDDFDVAYFSDKASPHEVKQEMISIIAGLAASDPRMVIRLVNFFFKVRVGKCAIDVFPAWHDGEVLWSPWSTRIECDGDLLKALVEHEFHGRRVLVPARAEEFLQQKYGAGWRTPDPAYRMQSLPSLSYPFRRIPFNEDDRTRIVEAARGIAGGGAIARVRLMKE